MNTQIGSLASPTQVEVNKVLRNTYFFLSLNLIFAALVAVFAMYTNARPIGFFLFMAVVFGVGFVIDITKNSHWGLFWSFVYTGFLGYTLGPTLNFYIKNFSNGPELIMMALGGTGLIFLILSAISLNPKRNFANWGTFILVGFIAALAMFGINYFWLHSPIFMVIIGFIFMIVSGALIMQQTSSIVHGGERNYITATVAIFAGLYNIFLILLTFLGMVGGDRN